MKTMDRTFYSLCEEIDDLKEAVSYWKQMYETGLCRCDSLRQNLNMKTEKLLEDFLKWVDEKTYWKEDNDIPNHVIVREYVAQSKHLHKPVVGGPGSDVRSEGELLGNEGSATVAVRGLYCVSSDSLVYGKSCEKWCGDENCVRKSSEEQP